MVDKYRWFSFPEKIADQLHHVHATLTSLLPEIHQFSVAMKEESKYDERGNVEALLGVNTLPSNERIERYRSGAPRFFNHFMLFGLFFCLYIFSVPYLPLFQPFVFSVALYEEYKQWECPEYLEALPTPAILAEREIKCTVVIPSSKSGSEGYQSQTHIILNKDTLVHDVLATCLKKWRALGGQIPQECEYVLKVQGMSEFLTGGGKKMMDYCHIRDCTRERKPVTLQLVQKPTKEEKKTELKPVKPPKPVQKIPKPVMGNDLVWIPPQMISQAEMQLPFRIKVCGVDGLTAAANPRLADSVSDKNIPPTISVESLVYFGQNKLLASRSEQIDLSSNPRWMQWMKPANGTDLLISNIPREARLGFVVFAHQGTKREPIAFTCLPLVNESGELAQGSRNLGLWALPPKLKKKHEKKSTSKDDAEEDDLSFLFQALCSPNPAETATNMCVQFDQFMLPVIAASPLNTAASRTSTNAMAVALTNTDKDKLDRLITRDALYKLTEDEKQLIWQARSLLSQHSHMLPFFLQSVQWEKTQYK